MSRAPRFATRDRHGCSGCRRPPGRGRRGSSRSPGHRSRRDIWMNGAAQADHGSSRTAAAARRRARRRRGPGRRPRRGRRHRSEGAGAAARILRRWRPRARATRMQPATRTTASGWGARCHAGHQHAWCRGAGRRVEAGVHDAHAAHPPLTPTVGKPLRGAPCPLAHRIPGRAAAREVPNAGAATSSTVCMRL